MTAAETQPTPVGPRAAAQETASQASWRFKRGAAETEAMAKKAVAAKNIIVIDIRNLVENERKELI